MNETKLTLERLNQISKALEIKIERLLGILPNKIYKQKVAENGSGYQDIKGLYVESKDTLLKLVEQYEMRIQEKDDLIKALKKQID